MGTREYAHQWIVYPQNIGTHLVSQGELYTIVTNKKAKGKKGSLVAIVAGTKTEQVIEQVSDQEQNLGRSFAKMNIFA
ncbi:hypothetical protein [Flavobacterium sp. Arc2]|uniref:hypothetical protein n=1 Tax=Flavobacterium sp. Arc2 TaxID=3046685 RepID=UPI00352EE450